MLAGSGISTDIWTSYAARIMVISVIPFVIVQMPQILGSSSGRHLAVLIALIFSLLLLVAYCLYQVTATSLQHAVWVVKSLLFIPYNTYVTEIYSAASAGSGDL